MVLFNYALKELTAKIVYYGPGLSGKTTNLKYIHEEVPIKSKGRMLTLATETDRTLYFDFLPVEAGIVRGIKTRIQLYTVPGQVFYNATRRMVLKGADGVVFVADSQKDMMEANLESLENLKENLAAHDLELGEVPFVLQYNKRDLEDALSIEDMNEELNKLNVPFYAAVAIEGIGVEDTLRAVSALVLKSVTEKYGAAKRSGRPSLVEDKDVPASSEEQPVLKKENTDPFTASRAVSSAVGGADALAADWDGEMDKTADSLNLGVSPGSSLAGEPVETPRNWSSHSAEAEVKPTSDKKNNELGDLDSLNLEGILDEALKVEEQDDVDEEDPLEVVLIEDLEDSKVETRFSGALEEALDLETGGEAGVLSAVQDPFSTSPRAASNPPLAKEEVDPLEGRFDVLSTSPGIQIDEAVENRPYLDELARTQVAPDIGEVLDLATSEPVSDPTSEVKSVEVIEVEVSPEDSDPRQVVVPIHVTMDPDAEEAELHVALFIKIRRGKP